MNKFTSHVLDIQLNISVEWQFDDSHCCEDDPYPIITPQSACYSINEGEPSYYYFGDAEDNSIEELITRAVDAGEITYATFE